MRTALQLLALLGIGAAIIGVGALALLCVMRLFDSIERRIR